LLQAILPIIQKRAQELKNSDDAAEVLAWRYALKKDEVTSWLSKTEWSNQLTIGSEDIQNVIETLRELQLVTDEEQTNWSEKVFQ
jgi:hypothetical protein